MTTGRLTWPLAILLHLGPCQAATPDDAQWASYGRDHTEQRYSPLTQIHRSNVHSLALDWALDRATRSGFDSVTVACEPTGHRWRVLAQLAAGSSRSAYAQVAVPPNASCTTTSSARSSARRTTD